MFLPEAIHQLLRQRPAVAAIAVPGNALGRRANGVSVLRSGSLQQSSPSPATDRFYRPFFHVKA